MASGKTTAGWVVGILGLLMCLGCVGFVLLFGFIGPGGVGSAEWKEAFPDRVADAGSP